MNFILVTSQSSKIVNEQLFLEIEVESGRIFTKPSYLLSHEASR